ncbi:MAG TPA: HEAT repeat domain-containing protein [Acidimicrobiales bacterium]
MIEGRRRAALAGHRGDEQGAREAVADPVPAIRATSLGALARMGKLRAKDITSALDDPSAVVRRRACEVSVRLPEMSAAVTAGLIAALADPDPWVVESACYGLGEEGTDATSAVSKLSDVAVDHGDALCREAAVAALGAIADPRGLPAILAGTTDKTAVRRRAVLALATFDGPEVDAALERAAGDRDWQVRQGAEDLRSGPPGTHEHHL